MKIHGLLRCKCSPVLPGCVLASVVVVSVNHAQAQTWPLKPVRVVLPVPAGGIQDGLARAMAPELGRRWGQSVLVENRAGANGRIATEFVARSPADGYTILIASPSSISVNPLLNPRLGYVPDKDLLPISRMTSLVPSRI